MSDVRKSVRPGRYTPERQQPGGTYKADAAGNVVHIPDNAAEPQHLVAHAPTERATAPAKPARASRAPREQS